VHVFAPPRRDGKRSGIIDNKAHLVTEHVSLRALIRMLIEDPAFPVV
jgi:hypothetical protein